jgi:signal transduction histidine kinase
MNLAPLLNLLSSPVDENSADTIGSRLPFAEIDSDGIVRGVNSLANIAWGWVEGSRISYDLKIILDGVSSLEASELPLQLGGLVLGVIPNPENKGWIFIGYAPQESNIRDAIVGNNWMSRELNSEFIRSESQDGSREDFGRQYRDRKTLRPEAKMAFISTLSHEIRSPIGSIAGYTELLGKELVQYQRHSGMELPILVFDFLRVLEERTASLQQIVKDLFDLSELQGDDVAVNRESVDLNAVVRRAAVHGVSLLENSLVDLTLKLSDTSIFVMSEAGRLEQIVEYVLSNAIKFTDSGEIIIRSELNGESAVLEIEDTGIGISDEFMPEIFDSLSQEDSRRSRQYNGTGMGLALTQRLLERLGGSIDVKSTKGEGSVFRIEIPVDLCTTDTDDVNIAGAQSGAGFRSARPIQGEGHSHSPRSATGDHHNVRGARDSRSISLQDPYFAPE